MNGPAKWAAVLFQLTLCSLSAPSQRIALSDSWHVLNGVTHDTTYIILEANGTCRAGRIVGVNDRFLRVVSEARAETGPSKLRNIEHNDIVRITDFSDDIHHLVYSGRSSWSDVRELRPRSFGEELVAITADGQSLDSKDVDVSENSLLFRGLGAASVPKSNLKAVYYVRPKPLTSHQEFVVEENAVLLEPKLWFGGAFLGKIRVLIYDNSKPENNSPLKCGSDLH